MQLGASARRGPTCGPPGSRRLVRVTASSKPSQQGAGDVKSARLARILRQYQANDVAKQQADLEAYIEQREVRRGDPEEPGSSRVLRASAGQRATDDAYLARLDKFTPVNAAGVRMPNHGLYGKGEMQWWALQVKAGREKQVAEAVENMAISYLPPLEPSEEGGEPQERVVETWVPKKVVKVWNPKTEKVGSKTLKYPARYPEVLVSGDNGGWVLAKFVMDNAIFQRVASNPSFITWLHVETFEAEARGGRTEDRVTYQFPKPCPQAVLDEIRDWEMDLLPVDEQRVRAFLKLSEPKNAGWMAEADLGAEEAEQYGGRERYGGRGGRGAGRFGGRGGGRFEDRQRDRYGGDRRRDRGYDDWDRSDADRAGGWFEGGSSGGGRMRERQGAGLYASDEDSGGYGGGRGAWREGGGRGGRGGRGERGGRGAWREGGRERDWEQRGSSPGRGRDRAYGSTSSGDWEDRRQERWEGGAGGRQWEDRRQGRGGQQWEDRRAGGRERRGSDSWERRDGSPTRRRDRDPASEPAPGGSWYDGGAAGSGQAMDSTWADSPAPQGSDGGSFGGWFDSAAAAFDFEAPATASGAAAGEAGESAWSWDSAMQPQQPAGAPADQPAPAPAVDTAGVWDEPDVGSSWAAPAAGADAAFGFPAVAAHQQQGGERREWRGERSERGGRFGDRGGRFGDRERGGRFGERGGRGGRGGRFGDRDGRRSERSGGRGGRFERSDRRRSYGDEGSTGGGWYEGPSSGASAAPSRSSSPADLSWWDMDGNSSGDASDDAGFAGVYSGKDWEGQGRDEGAADTRRRSPAWRGDGWGKEGGEDRSRGQRRSRDSGVFGDSWSGSWDGEGAGSTGGGRGGEASGADVAAAAAFQPGQQVAVTGGNFRDFEGTVVQAEGGKVTAELDIFGKRTRVELSPADISKAEGGSDA